MNIFAGQTPVQVCGLTPGNTYQFIAVGAYPGQTASFRLNMASAVQESAAEIMSDNNRPQMRRFTADAECVELLLTGAGGAGAEIPMFLSLSCVDCPETNAWRDRFIQDVADAPPPGNLGYTQGNTAVDLVTNVLVGGNCFDVSNFSSKGNANSRGTFSNGQGTINIANGVVLCTGPVADLPGPNSLNNKSGGFTSNSADDTNLAKLTSGDQYDVSIIEFDFRPTANMVQFDFVFGSEEYCEYVNTQYNDVFGFFISGPGITGVKNLAVIPNTNTPVTVNDVNHQKNSIYYRNNKKFDVCAGLSTVDLTNIQLDGFTSVLTATANLQPCQTYHIKLAIADVSDADYTSAVFLRANSFDAGGDIKAAPVYATADSFTTEGCTNGHIRFFRGSGNTNQPLQVSYTVAGGSTAIPGLDYQPLPTSVTIPAGQNEVLVPVNIINDQLAEGAETITLLLDNPCSCLQQDVTFVIRDQVPLSIDLKDQLGCAGFVNLTPTLLNAGLPPLTYQWNTGQTTPTLNVTTSGVSTYSVTVTDACGLSATGTANATVGQTPTAVLSGDIQFCPGGSGQLPVTLTGTGPWTVGILANGIHQTQTFTASPGLINVSLPGTYTLDSVVSQIGCVGLAGGTSTVQEINVQVDLAAQSPRCFGSTNGSLNAVVTSNAPPPYTFTWNTGASGPSIANVPAGAYFVTVTTPQGCFNVGAATLTEPPLLTVAIAEISHINCIEPIGQAGLDVRGGTPGFQYAWSNGVQLADATFSKGGLYMVTVTDQNQCTALASVTIAENTTPPDAVASALGEITCNTEEVTLSINGSSSGSDITYGWTTTDGHIVPGTEETTPRVDAAGTYTLVVTNNANGCTQTAQALVVENTNYPQALDLDIKQPGCGQTPGAIHIDGVQGGQGPYLFSLDGGNSFISQSSFLDLPAGAYNLAVQDINGCEFTQSVSLVSPLEPEVTVTPDVKLNYGESALLTAVLNLPLSDIDSIFWTPGFGLTPTSRPTEVWAQPFKSTVYTVTVISKDGCTDAAQLNVRVGDPHIYAPNAFKPEDASAENDMFQLFSNDNTVALVNSLQVFDRWGNQVFSRDHYPLNSDRSNGWDGRFKGRKLEPGVFTWWAEVQLTSGEQVQLRGDVTLFN